MPTHIFLRLTVILGALLHPLVAFAQQAQDQGLILLEPIGGVTSIPVVGNEGLGVFGFYFNTLYPWVVGMAAGVAVFNGVLGAIQIIQAGSGDGVTKGKDRFLISMGGLILILASATIMSVLNPNFFR